MLPPKSNGVGGQNVFNNFEYSYGGRQAIENGDRGSSISKESQSKNSNNQVFVQSTADEMARVQL